MAALALVVATGPGVRADAPAPHTVLVGDSLVWSASQQFADLLTGTNGRATFVAASSGASVPNFINRGWLDNPPWGGPDLATIREYNAFLRARVTVVALGTNDVRIMAGYPDTYDQAGHRAALATAVTQAKASSRCVFLVNPADHSGPERSVYVEQVDQNIIAVATRPGIFRVDWKGYSAGHEDWFKGPSDPHHSTAGRLYYADLINRSVDNQIDAGRC